MSYVFLEFRFCNVCLLRYFMSIVSRFLVGLFRWFVELWMILMGVVLLWVDIVNYKKKIYKILLLNSRKYM